MNRVDFSEWLESMRTLPASDPQWGLAGEFITAASTIIEAKENEVTRLAELQSILKDLRVTYSTELAYLERSIVDPCWAGPVSLDDALSKILQLRSLLADYASIRDRVPMSFSEEEDFVARKIDLGNRIRAEILQLNQLLADVGPDSVPAEEDNIPKSHKLVVDRPSDKAQSHLPEVKEGDAAQEHEDTSEDQQTGDDGFPKRNKTERSPLAEQSIESEQEPEQEQVPVESKHLTADSNDSVVEPVVPDTKETDSVEPCVGVSQDDNAQDDDLEPERAESLRYELVSSTKAAKRYCISSSESDLEALMWSLVAEDDLSAAYWIAEHLSALNGGQSLSPMLLRAVQGARWLSSDSDTFVGDLFEIVAEYAQQEVGPAQELLEFAASIYASAVAPHSPTLAWLKTPNCCPELDYVVRPIRDFASKVIPLKPEYLSYTLYIQAA